MELVRRHFSAIDSTNTWCKQHAEELPRDKVTLVTADSQLSGRGRFNRRWESPAGQNIYASFCFFLDKECRDFVNIPQVLALSSVKLLEELGFHPTLKWPNDILLSQKKCGGILAESTMLSDHLCLILGIGLNVNMPLEALQKIGQPATSLSVEGGAFIDVEIVLQRLQELFCENLDLFLKKGFSVFLPMYRRSLPVGKWVRFQGSGNVWEGILDGVNEDGSLRLRLQDGEIKTFFAGEIIWNKG